MPREAKTQQAITIVEQSTPENMEDIGLLVADPINTQIAYDNWVKQRELERKRAERKGYDACSCVSYAKFKTGYNETVGRGKNWPVNSPIPIENGIVVTSESPAGHVAYITSVKIGEIDVIEANYHACQVTTRTIKTDNPMILGYWKN